MMELNYIVGEIITACTNGIRPALLACAGNILHGIGDILAPRPYLPRE